MNTTEKGNELENEVYEWINEILDRFGSLVKLRKHKKYLCSNGREIVFDVCVDIFLNRESFDNDKPSTVYIFECKNLNNVLNISDFDEWKGKLDDIGKTGHKLFIVTRNGFSESTKRLAESANIGLVVFPSGSSANFLVMRSINNIAKNDFIDALFGNVKLNEIVCYDNYSYMSFHDLFLNNGIPLSSKYRIEIPFIKNSNLETYVNGLISKYGWNLNILNVLCDCHIPSIITQKMSNGHLGYLDILSSNITSVS